MWYFIIVGVAALTFYLSPWQPLLQASVNMDVRYRIVAGRFELYTPIRILLTAVSIIAPWIFLALSDSAAFVFAWGVPFAILYWHDFVTARRVVAEYLLDMKKRVE